MNRVLNIILTILLVLATIWFLTDVFGYYLTNTPPERYKLYTDSVKILKDSTHVLKQPTDTLKKIDFDWNPVFSFFSTVILFFLKYVFYDRKLLKNKDTNVNNLNHSLFLNLKEIDYTELPVVQLATAGKTVLYRQMIRLQLEIVEETIKEFLELNVEFKNSLDFSNKVKKLILDISNKTSLKWKEHGVPKLVIDTYKELEYDRLLILNNAIDNIALYASDDWNSALREVLNHISTHIQLFITEDTLEVFSKLNGRLKGIYFQGVEL